MRSKPYILTEEEKRLIMHLFWTLDGNTDKQLANLLEIPQRVVSDYITQQLDIKFKKLNERTWNK